MKATIRIAVLFSASIVFSSCQQETIVPQNTEINQPATGEKARPAEARISNTAKFTIEETENVKGNVTQKQRTAKGLKQQKHDI